MAVEWVPKPPDDEAVRARFETAIERGFEKHEARPRSITLRKTDAGWLVEGALRASSSGEPAVDVRGHVTVELQRADLPAVGVEAIQGAPPLSAEREAAIRSAVAQLTSQELANPPHSSLHFQVASDLLGEIDRLRGKLQLAGLARDLAGRAAATLRDACDDVLPRGAGRKRKPIDPNG